MSKTQQRLRKFSRDPAAATRLASRHLTHTSLATIQTIERYRLIPTSLLLKLVGGNPRNVYRHLQVLYHRGLVNRFCFFGPSGRPGEFNYFLDNPKALELLAELGNIDLDSLDMEAVKRNREKWTVSPDEGPTSPGQWEDGHNEVSEGQRYFLRHELMISRFHGALELACSASAGRVELSDWRQGATLWNRVEASRIARKAGRWTETDDTEHIAHRPDALFSLKRSDEGEARHYLYEADRKTSNSSRLIKKLRGHFLFVVKYKKQLEVYGLNRIRAVLIETLDTKWAEVLRQAARHPAVSGRKPSALFWFTSSEFFAKRSNNEQNRPVPDFLENPQIIFNKLWLTPLSEVGDLPLSLLD
jgi:protein involved in plasmid replication-relaxation